MEWRSFPKPHRYLEEGVVMGFSFTQENGNMKVIIFYSAAEVVLSRFEAERESP